jgi:hypothetical protein
MRKTGFSEKAKKKKNHTKQESVKKQKKIISSSPLFGVPGRFSALVAEIPFWHRLEVAPSVP